jgi:hypothetical protein
VAIKALRRCLCTKALPICHPLTCPYLASKDNTVNIQGAENAEVEQRVTEASVNLCAASAFSAPLR